MLNIIKKSALGVYFFTWTFCKTPTMNTGGLFAFHHASLRRPNIILFCWPLFTWYTLQGGTFLSKTKDGIFSPTMKQRSGHCLKPKYRWLVTFLGSKRKEEWSGLSDGVFVIAKSHQQKAFSFSVEITTTQKNAKNVARWLGRCSWLK